MANIKTIIKNIVENNLGSPVTFIMGWEAMLNLKADKVKIFPIGALFIPIKYNLVLAKSGYIGRKSTIFILFANKVIVNGKRTIDNTAEEHDVVIQEMQSLSTKFVQQCEKAVDSNGRRYFKNVENANEEELYNDKDIGVTGIILSIDLTPFNSDSFC